MSRVIRLLRRHCDALIVAAIVLVVLGAVLIRNDHLQAVQQQQGRLIEQRLCTTLDRIAALQPPAGSPAANPSRAYEQRLHAELARLGADVGCRPSH